MSDTDPLDDALRQYQERFSNLSELMHPAAMMWPGFADFLLRALHKGEPASRDELAQAVGGMPENW